MTLHWIHPAAFARVRSVAGERSGTTAFKFAMVLPILLLISGTAIDHGRFLAQRTLLQGAADAAALAAASELGLTDTKRETLAMVAEAVVKSRIAAQDGIAGAAGVKVTTSISPDPLEVDVTIGQEFKTAFGDVFGLAVPQVRARAIARVIGKPNICALGLNPSRIGTISLEHHARVTGNNCAVFSNSTNYVGIMSKNSATLSASLICSAGGVQGGGDNFTPAPVVDCPTFADPLAARPEPTAGPCDSSLPKVVTSSRMLYPGTYCGLSISNGAQVTLSPGIYVIKDAPLVVTGGASLSGQGVGFYFTGSATLTFDRLSAIALQAPTAGLMAGLLMFGARSQPAGLVHGILSDDARLLVGTIYFPKGGLRIDATQPIADKSAYTAVVADTIRLYGGPHLVLNSNYEQTDVPVPEGIRGAGQPVTLRK